MSDEKKPEQKQPTVKEVLEEQKNDTSWKCDPWVGPDGFQYRKNRVKNKDGSYTIFTVKVGEAPLVKPKK